MRRVLFVTYYFPPLGGIGSIRAASFATHLPAYGWMPTVLAPRQGAYYRDPELTFPEDQVIRSGSWELSRIGKRVLRTGGTDTAAASVAGLRGRIQAVARRFAYFPDAQIGWYPPALLCARRAFRDQKFDAIFSSSFPVTVHLIASHLRSQLRIPWIAEFRDPWSEMLPAGTSRRGAALRVERRIAQQSDRLVMTSPSWASRHSELWNRPVATILNGHDGNVQVPRTPQRRFTLAYLGSYYPDTQRLDAAWDAVRHVNQEGHLTVDRIRLVGEAHPQLLHQLETRNLGSLVEVTGFLPHRDSLEAAQESSVLLVAGPSEASGILRGQVAAKIAEYLGSSQPIIYVGDPQSDAADLLRQYEGTYIVPTRDVASMVSALKASSKWSGRRDTTELSRSRLTGRLAALLDEVTG